MHTQALVAKKRIGYIRRLWLGSDSVGSALRGLYGPTSRFDTPSCTECNSAVIVDDRINLLISLTGNKPTDLAKVLLCDEKRKLVLTVLEVVNCAWPGAFWETVTHHQQDWQQTDGSDDNDYDKRTLSLLNVVVAVVVGARTTRKRNTLRYNSRAWRTHVTDEKRCYFPCRTTGHTVTPSDDPCTDTFWYLHEKNKRHVDWEMRVI